jgi:hypothetical protein
MPEAEGSSYAQTRGEHLPLPSLPHPTASDNAQRQTLALEAL